MGGPIAAKSNHGSCSSTSSGERRTHWHEGRVRHQPVRHVYGEAGRGRREGVHGARRAGVRLLGYDDRGLSDGVNLHPLQEAFWNNHGLQCGFCTPGMIIAADELLRTNPSPTREEIRHGLEGNICRCTGYQNIVKAVEDAAGVIGGS